MSCESTGSPQQERDRNRCRVCGQPVVIVQNHMLKRGSPGYRQGIGPMREAVHAGDEGGRTVVIVKASTFTSLKVKLHDKCEAKRERATFAVTGETEFNSTVRQC